MKEKLEDLLNKNEIVLEVSTYHNAYDGPRDVSCWEDSYCIPFANLKLDSWYGTEDYRFRITGFDKESITIEWEGYTLTARYGKGAVRATISEAKPYMVRYDTTLYFEFKEIGPVDRLDELVKDIEWKYKHGKKEGLKEDKMLALELLDALIERGHIELYPMKALLASASEWRYYKIGEEELFREILGEGFRKHCLKGQPKIAQRWINKAWEVNRLTYILKDKVLEMYYKKR